MPKGAPHKFEQSIVDWFQPIACPPERPLALWARKVKELLIEDNSCVTSCSIPNVSWSRITSGFFIENILFKEIFFGVLSKPLQLREIIFI